MKGKDISEGRLTWFFSGIAVSPEHWHPLPLLFWYTLDLEHQRGRKRIEDWAVTGCIWGRVLAVMELCGTGGWTVSTASYSYASKRQRSFPWDEWLARTEIMWESNKEKSNQVRPGVHTMCVRVCVLGTANGLNRNRQKAWKTFRCTTTHICEHMCSHAHIHTELEHWVIIWLTGDTLEEWKRHGGGGTDGALVVFGPFPRRNMTPTPLTPMLALSPYS